MSVLSLGASPTLCPSAKEKKTGCRYLQSLFTPSSSLSAQSQLAHCTTICKCARTASVFAGKSTQPYLLLCWQNELFYSIERISNLTDSTSLAHKGDNTYLPLEDMLTTKRSTFNLHASFWKQYGDLRSWALQSKHRTYRCQCGWRWA